jgi:hypothetical protein
MNENVKQKIIKIQHDFRDGYITRKQRDEKVKKLKGG